MSIQKPDKELLHDPRNLQITMLVVLLSNLDGLDDERGREPADDLEDLLVESVRSFLARSVDERDLKYEDQVLEEVSPLSRIVLDRVEKLPDFFDGLRDGDVFRLAPVYHLDEFPARFAQIGRFGVADHCLARWISLFGDPFANFGKFCSHFMEKNCKDAII